MLEELKRSSISAAPVRLAIPIGMYMTRKDVCCNYLILKFFGNLKKNTYLCGVVVGCRINSCPMSSDDVTISGLFLCDAISTTRTCDRGYAYIVTNLREDIALSLKFGKNNYFFP